MRRWDGGREVLGLSDCVRAVGGGLMFVVESERREGVEGGARSALYSVLGRTWG